MKNEIRTVSEQPSFLYKILFILVVLSSIYFWNLKMFPPIYNIYHVFGWLFCIVGTALVIGRPGMRFKYPILLFLIGLVVNFYASYKNLHQSIYESFFSFSFYYFILLYFMLHFMKLGDKFVENSVLVLAFIYSVIFVWQYKVFPKVIFNYSAQTALEEKQFEILGHGFLVLGYLLALNKFFIKFRWVYLGLSLFFMLVLFKCGFRTLIASAAGVTLIMVARLVRFNLRDILIVIAVFGGLLALTQYKSVSNIIDNAVNKTEDNLKQGKAYVRNVEKEYYYNVYPRNLSYYIIGGGKPAGRNLYMFDYDINTVKLNYNIVWVDIGLRGFYFVVGGIALLGMLWFAFKAIFTKVPRDKIYLGMYFLYLLGTSFTNEEIYRDGIFVVQAIALYLIDQAANSMALEKKEAEQKAAPVTTR